MFVFLTLSGDKIEAQIGPAGAPTEVQQITTVAAVDALVNAGHNVFSSSSLDFPEEYTDDEDLIALCQAIRGDAAFGG